MGEIYLSRRRRPAGAGKIDIIGQTGTVTNDLDPEGVVRVGNETWTAISIDDTVIPAGEKVVVTGVSELILTVARAGPGGV
jgi:membrane-bound ClpP family serine protease